MNDKIAEYRSLSADYREYIELWVHEIKTPISAARLTAENSPGSATKSIDGDLKKIEAMVANVLYYSRSNTVEKDLPERTGGCFRNQRGWGCIYAKSYATNWGYPSRCAQPKEC